MKVCGHEHTTVPDCDTCYIVVLKKRVARLLAAEHKRLDRITELEGQLKWMVENAATQHRPAYDEQQRRIAKLEWEYASVVNQFHDALAHNTKLEAENQRLREASKRVLSALLPGEIIHIGHEHVRYSATYSIAGRDPVLELQALLEVSYE